MIERSSIVIDNNKSKEFKSFLKTKAKNQKFWNNVKKDASKQIDKKYLDRLFK